MIWRWCWTTTTTVSYLTSVTCRSHGSLKEITCFNTDFYFFSKGMTLLLTHPSYIVLVKIKWMDRMAKINESNGSAKLEPNGVADSPMLLSTFSFLSV